ncbi:MAG: Nif3-like dinuclear metal center hexameric protein [Bacteroidales bacterium]|nr:Nif3-like dinuclear metal center hexameric protein [Bacteroidales bacterium]
MRLREIIDVIEKFAPGKLQESYDNSGIQVGNPNNEISATLICIDITEEVFEEAIRKNCNLIISHHPLIFSGLKSIAGRNSVEKIIIKAIKADINILSIHTNLDSAEKGVSNKLAEKIGLKNIRTLSPLKNQLQKLVFFIPIDNAENVRAAIFKAGAGHIGNYDSCSFNMQGKGTFRGLSGSKPFVGKSGSLHVEDEIRVETIVPEYLMGEVVRALLESHPYEEVAYDIYSLVNTNKNLGMGAIGELEQKIETEKFLSDLKSLLGTTNIRITKKVKEKINKVAVCGGSGSFLLKEAIKQGADVFISGDFKYHQFFEAENKIVIADIGHFESEQFTKEIIYDLLINNFPKFAVHLSEINTNPIINF